MAKRTQRIISAAQAAGIIPIGYNAIVITKL